MGNFLTFIVTGGIITLIGIVSSQILKRMTVSEVVKKHEEAKDGEAKWSM